MSQIKISQESRVQIKKITKQSETMVIIIEINKIIIIIIKEERDFFRTKMTEKIKTLLRDPPIWLIEKIKIYGQMIFHRNFSLVELQRETKFLNLIRIFKQLVWKNKKRKKTMNEVELLEQLIQTLF